MSQNHSKIPTDLKDKRYKNPFKDNTKGSAVNANLVLPLADFSKMLTRRSKFFVQMRSNMMRILNVRFMEELSECNLAGQFRLDYPKKEIAVFAGPEERNGRMPDSPRMFSCVLIF